MLIINTMLEIGNEIRKLIHLGAIDISIMKQIMLKILI